jgi:hypothetical protein
MAITDILKYELISAPKKCSACFLCSGIFLGAVLKKNAIIGSGEFLLSGYELKSTGEMTGGHAPVPPYPPCAYRDGDVLPVQEVSHFLGEHKAVGVKPLLSD